MSSHVEREVSNVWKHVVCYSSVNFCDCGHTQMTKDMFGRYFAIDYAWCKRVGKANDKIEVQLRKHTQQKRTSHCGAHKCCHLSGCSHKQLCQDGVEGPAFNESNCVTNLVQLRTRPQMQAQCTKQACFFSFPLPLARTRSLRSPELGWQGPQRKEGREPGH